jgi:hypothetical protein
MLEHSVSREPVARFDDDCRPICISHSLQFMLLVHARFSIAYAWPCSSRRHELHPLIEEGLRKYLLERDDMVSVRPNLMGAYYLADLVETTSQIALFSALIPA